MVRRRYSTTTGHAGVLRVTLSPQFVARLTPHEHARQMAVLRALVGCGSERVTVPPPPKLPPRPPRPPPRSCAPERCSSSGGKGSARSRIGEGSEPRRKRSSWLPRLTGSVTVLPWAPSSEVRQRRERDEWLAVETEQRLLLHSIEALRAVYFLFMRTDDITFVNICKYLYT